MKKVLSVLGIIISILFVSACKKDNKIIDCQEKFGLDKDSIVFESKTDSVVIYIKPSKKWWWINYYKTIVLDETIGFQHDSNKKIIEGKWFSVNGETEHQIKIKVTENELKRDRYLIIGIQTDVSCLKNIYITQKGTFKQE